MGGSQTWSFLAALALLAFVSVDKTAAQTPACVGRSDIALLVDSSASIGDVNFALLQDFLVELTGEYFVDPHAIQFSTVIYSGNAQILFRFNDFNHQGSFSNNITNAPYLAGPGSNTAAALSLCRTTVFSEASGARAADATRVAIVFTDGSSDNPAETANQANLLQNEGVTVVAVGIAGGAGLPELNSIASSPQLVFSAPGFGALRSIRDALVQASCIVNPQPCLEVGSTCVGRPDGSYAICNPVCSQGQFLSCSNTFSVLKPCGLGYYRNAGGSSYTAPMVYNALEDCCELFVAYCPRNPQDFAVVPPSQSPRVIIPPNPPCIPPGEDCTGRIDGNYPMCQPQCQDGFFFSCRAEAIFRRPCSLGTYFDGNGNPFVQRMIYDPSTDQCELFVASCPRGDVTVTPTPTTPTTSEPPCNGSGDILFILDASRSVGVDNFEIQRNFLSNLTTFFAFGTNSYLFSALVFSTNAQISFAFNDVTDRASLAQAISRLMYLNGGTSTDAALDLARNIGFTTANGERAGDPNFAIVVTDGVSFSPPFTRQAAQNLRNSGVTILVVGIGADINEQELLDIASRPDLVFTVTAFSDLNQITNSVVSAACPPQG